MRGATSIGLTAAFVAGLALWGSALEASAAAVAEVGEAPPLFELSDEHGTVHRLEEYLGRPVILYFTHNMCHYCTQVIGFLKRAHAKYESTDLAIITLNVWASDEKFIRRYKEQFGLPFLMLAGKNADLLKSYEVNYVPIIVFIGREGKIRNIYHHYILRGDFETSTATIVARE